MLLPGVFYSRGALDSWEAQNPTNFPQVIANQYLTLCKTTFLADPRSVMDDLYSGADHWYVSAHEYGCFIVDLRQGTYVGGTNCWNTMSQTRTPKPNMPEPACPGGDVRLGMWRFSGKYGEYFGYNGSLEFNDGTHITGSLPAGWRSPMA